MIKPTKYCTASIIEKFRKLGTLGGNHISPAVVSKKVNCNRLGWTTAYNTL